MLKRLKNWLASQWIMLRNGIFSREYIRYFDWPLIIIVLVLCGFGIVSIFAATAQPITEMPNNLVEMLSGQSIRYPVLQLVWVIVGIVIMMGMCLFDFHVFQRYSTGIYIGTVLMLLFVLGMEAGRGGMTAFFHWGSSGERMFQPSEPGKVTIIISLAGLFATRDKPINNLRTLAPFVAYIGVPIMLVVLQPDFGTAMVYLCIFTVMIFCSQLDWKLILTIVLTLVLIMIPAWYFLTMSSSDFRMTRILMWLNPEAYPDDARQIINAQLAIGSGGLFGKGVISVGSLASLGYISDDHTDMIFAIVCEAFGYVGGAIVIGTFLLLIIHLIRLSRTISDNFGAYSLLGVAALFLFHVMENIGMVIGLLPCTGIPLPFISYGGSHMITVWAAIGLVENIVMRERYAYDHPTEKHPRRL